MQCKDIPDLPILVFLSKHTEWCNWTDPNADYEYSQRSVLHAMPPNLPDKLVLGKMRQLIKRKLVDGCGCGCRGDFVLTEKGREYMMNELWKRAEIAGEMSKL